MASFLQFAHHCFFLVSSTACCFSDSVCFFTSATNRSLSCSRLCLISAIVSSALKWEKIKITWNSYHVRKGNICIYTWKDWFSHTLTLRRCGETSLVAGNSPRLCFISDNSCWCSHWSFSISILNRRICGKNTQKWKLIEVFLWNIISTSLDGRITSAIVFPDVLLERSL